MASIVTITTAAETVTCGPDGSAEHVFTVSNSSERPLRIGAQVLVEDQTQEDWLTIEEEPERDLAADGTDQITVRVQVPPGTEPGQYKFRLLVYSVRRPGEDFTNGPLVAVNVPAAATPPPEPVKRQGFPWWGGGCGGGARRRRYSRLVAMANRCGSAQCRGSGS